ncbi:MAG TPA: universal stress protein [Actinocrinis sp.]|nr:universal stress protein [Actinocrinis sp.]
MTKITTSPQSLRIIAGLDPSENAARAADWAAREALDRGLPLHLVHALGFPSSMNPAAAAHYFQAGRQTADALLDLVGRDLLARYPHLPVTTESSDLPAPEALVALSRTAVLVVVGTRGHGGFTGLLLGSVSLKVAAHAHCPVVVVRGEQPADPRPEIVLGVAPYQAGPPIEFAFATAEALGVRLRAVQAWCPIPAYGGYEYDLDSNEHESELRAEITGLLKAASERHPDVVVTTAVVRGNTVPVLIDAARGARLLVVGSHRRTSPLSLGAGYVDQGLLSHSPTPVAVVPVK